MKIVSSKLAVIAWVALGTVLMAGVANSGTEANKELYKDLEAMDKNHDSTVTGKEVRAGNRERAGVKSGDFARLDVNGDARISRKEAGAHVELTKRFKEMDANSDKFVTAEELRNPESK